MYMLTNLSFETQVFPYKFNKNMFDRLILKDNLKLLLTLFNVTEQAIWFANQILYTVKIYKI